MQSELLEPLLKRIVDILKKQGKIPDIRVDGKEVAIQFTSPMSRAQDVEELQSLQQFMQYAQMFSPEELRMQIKMEDVPKFIADKVALPASFVRSQAEKQQMAQQAAQVAQQAQQMQGQAQ